MRLDIEAIEKREQSAASVQPTHPSEFIRDELMARGWDFQDLAIAMHWRGSVYPTHEWIVANWPAIGTTILALEMYEAVGEDEDSRANCRLGSMAEEIDRGFGVSDGFFAALERAYLEKVTTP